MDIEGVGMGFQLPTQTTLVPGARKRAPELADRFSWDSILLVTDPGISETSWPGELEALLDRVAEKVFVFTDVEPNPGVETVDRVAELVRSIDADVVFGIGGGSTLDTAKCAAMLGRNEGSCIDFEGMNRFSNPSLPFVALPSTCGTGSEVTWVSVISDHTALRKFSVKGDGMFPFAALVDADLIETLPPPLIASTGMDALTHAVEAYISNVANPVSDILAIEAIRLLFDHLVPCYQDPGEPMQRERVIRASTLAGMAFGNADVGAVHCLSESIGGQCNLPHGLLNAVLLRPVLAYQMAAISDRLNDLNDRLPHYPHGLIERISDLAERLELPHPDELGVPAGLFPEIARLSESNNSNIANRKRMQAKDYLALLNQLF